MRMPKTPPSKMRFKLTSAILRSECKPFCTSILLVRYIAHKKIFLVASYLWVIASYVEPRSQVCQANICCLWHSVTHAALQSHHVRVSLNQQLGMATRDFWARNSGCHCGGHHPSSCFHLCRIHTFCASCGACQQAWISYRINNVVYIAN